ncbi:hypothetical protein [Pseudomonas vanderleydeniana]|uniref:Uncharacterized protein n=1 Tax=Pseudomonas vanderleydeniana TaxID=2745495 RepID=A0A9E6TR02_9PSED|nr:hypothetical protein [Pseudomonas vanderleydeniana]QXI27449.1 hypothetical protein HU752_026670 [Pseudomonas vanderleydeniana]
MTINHANLLHHHDNQADAITFDPTTGEIFTSREQPFRNHWSPYESWAAKRRADASLPEDHKKATTSLAALIAGQSTTQAPPPSTSTETTAPKRGRGRPKKVDVNPIASLAPVLLEPAIPMWVDDIIHGSVVRSAGVDNGKINVRMRSVIWALSLPEITTEACRTGVSKSGEMINLRTAQRIAQAARHSIHGIALHIERHPKIKTGLEAKRLAQAAFD